jgi:hypothetical protein
MMSFDSSLGGQPSTPADRATEFKAVEGDTGEQYNGYTLMVEAYAALWVVLMGWLLVLWLKQRDLNARIDGLEAAIARAERGATAKSKLKDVDGSGKKEPATEKSS